MSSTLKYGTPKFIPKRLLKTSFSNFIECKFNFNLIDLYGTFVFFQNCLSTFASNQKSTFYVEIHIQFTVSFEESTFAH